MRYVIINELYRMGGSEVQSLREQKIMKAHGHTVLYITFDTLFPDGYDTENEGHLNIVCAYSGLSKKLHRMYCDRRLSNRLSLVLSDFRPDYIHINIASEHALAIFKAVRPYPTFQTIRDYGAVCETGLCVDRQFEVCKGKKYNHCISRCMPGSKKAMFLYYCMVSRVIAKARVKSVCQFVCPSQMLTDYCNDHGLKTRCVNNPFDFSFLNGFCKKDVGTTKTYLFYGYVAEHKGVKQLLDAWEKFQKEKNVELLIAGKVSPEIEKLLQQPRAKVCYMGVKRYDEIIEVLSGVYVVIVPSLWMENYPNTVLEGLCTECLVLASNRGGMKEMIRDDRFIFDVLNQEDIVGKLNFSYEMPAEEYHKIVMKNLEFVKYNNAIETYYSRIEDMLPKLYPMEGNVYVKNSNIAVDAGNYVGWGRTTVPILNRELLCA